MKILISGASGLIGGALVKKLRSENNKVVRLVRGEKVSGSDCIAWQLDKGVLDRSALEGFDAVIHLAGENIAARRWSAEQKNRIEQSRVAGTGLIAQAMTSLEAPPKVFVCASAIGIYGDRRDEIVDETSPPGKGFLAEVCRKWEAAASVTGNRNTRVVNLRIGVVLAAEGGALAKMVTPIKLGLGGKLGSGRQYTSWIALTDLVAAVIHILKDENISGPVNIVSPNPVTNAEFTRTLARQLHRPAFFTVPSFLLKLIAGEMAESLLLASTRVQPAKLLQSGFTFGYTELSSALEHILS